MDSGSPFDSQPSIFTADFAFVVIFAILCFQLLLALLLTGIKMTWGGAFGKMTEQEVQLLRIHRTRYVILMAFTLISPIIVYSMQAVSMFYGFIDISTYYNVLTVYAAFWDIWNVFFSAVLIAVLDSGIKILQLRRYTSTESTATSIQGGTNVNIIVMSCIVVILVILTIARTVIIGELNAEYLANESNTITMPKWWAQFGLAQAHIFINVVFSIYYTVVAILMWRKKDIVPREPNEVDKNYGFRVLDRIIILVCPLLLLLTLYTIISDPIVETITGPNTIITADNYLMVLSVYFSEDFIWGVITIMLNIAIMGVGHVL